MATKKKQKIGTIFQVGAWLAFIMLGYLGIRGYKNSVEKVKINRCIEEIGELSQNIQDAYRSQRNYGELDYKTAVRLNLFPKTMFRKGFKEATNGYLGGVDLFYSSMSEELPNHAFEVSFQGISRMGCEALIRMNWDGGAGTNLIAVAGYSTPTPSGVLDEIYPSTSQDEIKKRNIFKGSEAQFVGSDKIDAACGCRDDTCSVVWKFR